MCYCYIFVGPSFFFVTRVRLPLSKGGGRRGRADAVGGLERPERVHSLRRRRGRRGLAGAHVGASSKKTNQEQAQGLPTEPQKNERRVCLKTYLHSMEST